MAALESTGGGPRRSPPNKRVIKTPGSLLLKRTTHGAVCTRQNAGRATSGARNLEPLPRWWSRGVTLLYQDGGGRLPARASPIPFKMSEQRRPRRASERRLRSERQGLGGAAAASAPVGSWQALSPVGAQKLPPQTLKQHSTTFPRVTKIIICVAQGRKLGPGKAQALRPRRAGGGGRGGRLPRGLP